MATQHTPGPWFHAERACTVWPTEACHLDRGANAIARTARIADARLVVEAPAMLELLRIAAPSEHLDARAADDWRLQRRAILLRVNGIKGVNR